MLISFLRSKTRLDILLIDGEITIYIISGMIGYLKFGVTICTSETFACISVCKFSCAYGTINAQMSSYFHIQYTLITLISENKAQVVKWISKLYFILMLTEEGREEGNSFTGKYVLKNHRQQYMSNWDSIPLVSQKNNLTPLTGAGYFMLNTENSQQIGHTLGYANDLSFDIFIF